MIEGGNDRGTVTLIGEVSNRKTGEVAAAIASKQPGSARSSIPSKAK
jgi:hypothetical protein